MFQLLKGGEKNHGCVNAVILFFCWTIRSNNQKMFIRSGKKINAWENYIGYNRKKKKKKRLFFINCASKFSNTLGSLRTPWRVLASIWLHTRISPWVGTSLKVCRVSSRTWWHFADRSSVSDSLLLSYTIFAKIWS